MQHTLTHQTLIIYRPTYTYTHVHNIICNVIREKFQLSLLDSNGIFIPDNSQILKIKFLVRNHSISVPATAKLRYDTKQHHNHACVCELHVHCMCHYFSRLSVSQNIMSVPVDYQMTRHTTSWVT